jgi:hypothetical protein
MSHVQRDMLSLKLPMLIVTGADASISQEMVLLADFWAAGRARNPLDFVRWVVPIKARGRYTAIHCLCSAIHRAEGVRRAWNSHFKLLAQVASATCTTSASGTGLGQVLSLVI